MPISTMAYPPGLVLFSLADAVVTSGCVCIAKTLPWDGGRAQHKAVVMARMGGGRVVTVDSSPPMMPGTRMTTTCRCLLSPLLIINL
jgi:hypothetical protein